jgi:hypothetical protein
MRHQLGRLLRVSAILVAASFACLSLTAPIASAQSDEPAEWTSRSPSVTALDPLSTGSIGTTANQARNTLENTHIDRAVANSMSSVQIPSYLSLLADRRILVLLSLIGLFVVWINRTPQSRDDSKY